MRSPRDPEEVNATDVVLAVFTLMLYGMDWILRKLTGRPTL